MAFENLENIFKNRETKYPEWKHNISENITGDSVSDNLFNHTFGTNYNYEELINITPIQNEQSPSPLMAIAGIGSEGDTIVNGHSRGKIRVNYQGGLLQNNIELNQKENYPYSELIMATPKPDLTLKNLGDTKYKIESLYDQTHGANTPDRIPFGEPGRISSDLQLHLTPKGDGIKNLNIRNSGAGSDQPFIVKPIGAKPPKGSRDSVPISALADDVIRFSKFYTSSKGLLQLLKENTTNYAIGDGFHISYPKGPFRSVLAPPIPGFNTGFLNGFGQGRRLQSSGTIPSFRKPFRIEYSKMVQNPLQKLETLANQGDVAAIGFDTAPLEKLLKKNRVELRKEEERKQEQVRLQFGLGSDPNQELSGVGQTMGQRIGGGLNKIKEGVLDAASIVKVKAQNAIIKQVIKQAEKITTIPSDVKPPRFLDLGGFGTVHRDPEKGYVDVFSNEESLFGGTSTEPPLESKDLVDKGDFYVRIKDLRDNKFIYFRGFVTGITENVTPSWNPVQYIGRSEDIWNYQKAERDLSFNLRIAPQNQTEFDTMYGKINQLTSLAYPDYHGDVGLMRMKPPFTELYMAHFGDKVEGQFGFVKSLTYTVNEQGDWDARSAKARVIDVAISYQILSRKSPSRLDSFYEGVPA